MKSQFWLTLIVTVMLTAVPAFADYTYTYTGHPFDEVYNYATGSYNSSDYIRGFITVAQPFQPFSSQLLGSSSFPAVLNFSFTDGHHTVDPSNSSNYFIDFQVGPTQDIISDWVVVFINDDVSIVSCGTSGYFDCVDGPFDVTYELPTGSGGIEHNNQGQWTAGLAAAVPEPSSLLMLAGGVLVFARKLKIGVNAAS